MDRCSRKFWYRNNFFQNFWSTNKIFNQLLKYLKGPNRRRRRKINDFFISKKRPAKRVPRRKSRYCRHNGVLRRAAGGLRFAAPLSLQAPKPRTANRGGTRKPRTAALQAPNRAANRAANRKPRHCRRTIIYPAIPAYAFLDKTFHAKQRGISSSLSTSLFSPPLQMDVQDSNPT